MVCRKMAGGGSRGGAGARGVLGGGEGPRGGLGGSSGTGLEQRSGQGTTVQCGSHQYRLGLYGWRRRCLYTLVLLLLVMVILNLALTLFILRVLDFTMEGMGGLQMVKGGMIASGEVHVMDQLVAARILSRPNTPMRILAANNFSIAATDADGRITNSVFMISDLILQHL
ncbi:delta-sarcoglycan-like [Homarus americanus]|uniref:delta-sarcoglycan-like n=1 Tax=Homarus americanus TaxID=6706 RepID=UPI001C46EBE0|nr:delta-sarcoglycan-like [Homarus americanus]